GPVLHPGALAPEVEPAEECLMPGDKGDIRVRRWNALHFEETRHTILDVLRIDDPAYPRPLVVGTTARELTTEEFLRAYPHRWPVETNFFVAQDTTAMEMPRAWTEMALERRISLSLLTGSLLQAIAAATGPLAMGPWDARAATRYSASRHSDSSHAGVTSLPPVLSQPGSVPQHCSPCLYMSQPRVEQPPHAPQLWPLTSPFGFFQFVTIKNC